MIHLHHAIRALNPSVVVIRGEEAFDEQGKSVAYDMTAAQAKLVEMQTAEAQEQQATEAAKQSAIDKLKALGLTDAEVAALKGTL